MVCDCNRERAPGPCCSRGALLPVLSRNRRLGNQPAGVLGARYNQLRFLDRHIARGHVDLGNITCNRSRVAQTGHSMCRGDHGLRSDDRRIVSDYSFGQAAFVLLAGALSE